MKITLKQILEELNDLALDMVKTCVPDCTPEEHAYHQGTWTAHLKLQEWVEIKRSEAGITLKGHSK